MKNKRKSLSGYKRMRSSSQVPKYGLGGDTLSGAASGAAAGAMFGPWGAAIGGVVGGVSGLVKGIGAKNDAEEARQKEIAMASDQSARDQKYADIQSMGPEVQYNAMVAAYGGEVGNPSGNTKTKKLSFDSDAEALAYYEDLGGSRLTMHNPSKNKLTYRGKDKNIKSVTADKTGYNNLKKYQFDHLVDHSKAREYAQGGVTDPIMPGTEAMYPIGSPAELEGGESGVTKQGDQFNVNGARHEDGGQMVNVPGEPSLEDGARIYSDRFGPNGKKGPTYSDLNKKIGKTISKSEEILNDPNATPIDRKTAELNAKKGRRRQDELFKNQESSPYKAKYSDTKGSVQTAAGGAVLGYPDSMMADGLYGYQGGVPGAAAYGMMHGFAEGFGGTPNDQFDIQSSPQMQAPQQYTNGLNLDMSVYDTNIDPMDDYRGRNNPLKSAGNAGGFMDKIGGGAGLASLAPGVINMARGLFEKPEVMDAVTVDPAVMRSQRYDNSAELRANRRSAATANRNIKNAANTRGELMGGYSANSAARGRADADSYARQGNMNAQFANQANQFNAQSRQQANQFNAQSQMRADQQNMANRAAKSNMFSKGLGQLSGAAQNIAMGQNLADMDVYKTQLFAKMFPEQNFNI